MYLKAAGRVSLYFLTQRKVKKSFLGGDSKDFLIWYVPGYASFIVSNS